MNNNNTYVYQIKISEEARDLYELITTNRGFGTSKASTWCDLPTDIQHEWALITQTFMRRRNGLFARFLSSLISNDEDLGEMKDKIAVALGVLNVEEFFGEDIEDQINRM